MTKTLTALAAAALMIPATGAFAESHAGLMAIGLSGDKTLHQIVAKTATVTASDHKAYPCKPLRTLRRGMGDRARLHAILHALRSPDSRRSGRSAG